MGLPALLSSVLSNIIHKRDVRVANLEQIANGLKEHNRKRVQTNITANNSAVNVFVAPFNARIEDLWVSSPTGTTSTSSNHVTITVTNVTQSTTLLSFDTHTNSVELLTNQGIEILVGDGISPSTGLPYSTINAGDLIAITILVTGTPGPTSASVMSTVLGLSSTSSYFAV